MPGKGNPMGFSAFPAPFQTKPRPGNLKTRPGHGIIHADKQDTNGAGPLQIQT